MKHIAKELIKIAHKLDENNELALASRVDAVLVNFLPDKPFEKPPTEEDKEEDLIKTYPYDETEAFLQEDAKKGEDFLRKHLENEEAYESIELYKDILNKVGVSLMATQDNSFLGHGSSGAVFYGIWNGKEVAVKITRDTHETLDNWNFLKSIYSTLSDTARKHIPIIYSTQKIKDINVIIMEKLSNPPKYLLDLITWSKKDITPIVNTNQILKNETDLYENIVISLDIAKISKKYTSPIFKKILELKLPEATTKTKVWKESFKFLRNQIELIAYNVIKDDIGYHEAQFFLRIFLEKVLLMIKPELPSNSEIAKKIRHNYENIPEIKSFIEALYELVEKGLYWNDLNYDNIMMREKTRELVLIDIGAYKLEL